MNQPFWFQPMSNAMEARWQRPMITLVFVIACLVVFLVENILNFQILLPLLGFRWPSGIFDPQIVNTITPIFFHGNLLHIGMNLSIFWFFSRQVEAVYGRFQVLLLILTAALVSNVLQAVVSGPNMIGISGVVMALIGFAWTARSHKPELGLVVPQYIMIFMLISIGLGYLGLLDMILGPIANTSHAAGLVFGILAYCCTYAFPDFFKKLL